MQNRKSTATVMNQLGAGAASEYFEQAEKLREKAIALAIQYTIQGDSKVEGNTLKNLDIQEKLLKAKQYYYAAIAAGYYRALCSTRDNIPGVIGGLYSLNGLLKDADLSEEVDDIYFAQHFNAAIEAGDANCLYVQAEIKKLETTSTSDISNLDDESTEEYTLSIDSVDGSSDEEVTVQRPGMRM